MSDKRRTVAYPSPLLYNKVHEQAENKKISVSKVVNAALKLYFKEETK